MTPSVSKKRLFKFNYIHVIIFEGVINLYELKSKNKEIRNTW